MLNNAQPRKAEHMHTKKCMSVALINAVENSRDLEEQYYSTHEFHSYLQSGGLVEEAYGYLLDGTIDCVCPPCELPCCEGRYARLFDTEMEFDAEYRGGE